ncbi:type II toxin-antitoxin system RelE/ParE family toxin [Polynucleobacter sp. UK-Mo-2m-Kol15]|uniref:type II toxin-antitoxin system RelE/ParE family toxin n=1 Tax=Polynucleobacter sp. UK-Mo-2m-Kol15 TaxID=2576916 RepID=UPI001C0CDFC5|nr:type II toxin-antitoxin system RelE/ParE family toxin [Polynucleobacter sp. UK-Mo-2m-Kol15]MBU3574729.1 type II toxin-antitoxin system RelE/ParE family toxin [Polynucleobacter sp. UK-Mo-2m-Kol15]
MYEINKTAEFETWLNTIRDPLTRGRLIARLRRVALGNLGDVAPISEGVSEMREHFGAGWRMYYIQRRKVIIVMLGGGCKSTQAADIKRVKKLLLTMED